LHFSLKHIKFAQSAAGLRVKSAAVTRRALQSYKQGKSWDQFYRFSWFEPGMENFRESSKLEQPSDLAKASDFLSSANNHPDHI